MYRIKLIKRTLLTVLLAFGNVASNYNLHAQDNDVVINYDIHSCNLPASPNILDYLATAVSYVHPAQEVVEDALTVAYAPDTSGMAVAGKIVDLRNGYVSVDIGWNEDAKHTEACYWRMNGQDDDHQRVLLGIYYWWPAEECAILFYEIDRTAGTIRAVPRPFTLPRRYDENAFLYELPRKGKTIKAVTYEECAADGSPLQIDLIFNGTSFDTKILGKSPEISAFPVLDENESEVGIYHDGNLFTRIVSSDAEYTFLTVSDPHDGWWTIQDAYLDADGIYTMSDVIGGEIEYKHVGAEARNYGGELIELRDEPSANAVVKFTIGKKNSAEEYYPPVLRLIDLSEDGEWVQVQVPSGIADECKSDHSNIGWIESVWLCGNPLTNCN